MDLKEILKDSVNIKDAADRLGIQFTTNTADYQLGNCPTGHPSDGGKCFGINIPQNYFHCFSCEIAGDVIRLVEIAKQCDFKEALRWLAENFRPDLVSKLENYKGSRDEGEDQYYRYAALYELLFEQGKKLLFEPDGADALAYLVNERRYAPDKIKQTDLIYFPEDKEIRNYLSQAHPAMKEIIDAMPLQGYQGDKFRLAFPYRDRRGVITGFVKRSIDPNAPKNERWDSTKGLRKHDLFGLHNCKGKETLVIVEGYPDALYFPALGMDNVVAVGQGQLSKKHLEGLRAFGVKRVILAFDNDNVGPENTEKAVKLLEDESDIDVYVIDPPLLGAHKDPDELVKAGGIDAFRKLVENPQKAFEWKFDKIIAKYDLTNSMQRDQALYELFDNAEGIRNAIDKDLYSQRAAKEFGFSEEAFEEAFAKYREKKAREQLSKEYKKTLRKSEQLLAEGDLEGLQHHLSDSNHSLRVKLDKFNGKSTQSLADFLSEKQEREKLINPGDLLGYRLGHFKNVCENLEGIQSGLYILAADTNVGKTAFVVSLCLDMLESNPELNALYFSLDDNKKVISNRFLSAISGLGINKVKHKQKIIADQNELDSAYEKLIEWSNQKRLDILDISEVMEFDTVESIIRERSGEKLVVFMDGLFNLDVGGNENGGIREENIDRANKLKQIVDIYDIPVITTGEIRKAQSSKKKRVPTKDDLMETGKFAYNANLVWVLYPDDAEKFRMEDEPVIVLSYEKNKISGFKGHQKLTFMRKQGRFEEVVDLSSAAGFH
ncbi:MAG: hypothetical protein CV087_22330 [Candidatus Brocadia sp. WS118]|nr:MAG: hypothetical protein CV087_22330 [Candidatus Brocadia sp. WS118]